MARFLVLLLYPFLLFSSSLMFLKYDKLVSSSNGDKIGNTLGYDLERLNPDFFGAIKIDKLLKSKSNIVINAANKLSWPGGADRSSPFYTSGYWSDNKKNNRVLLYSSEVALNEGTTLRFSISCGYIKREDSASLALYAYDNNVNRWIKVAYLTDFYSSYVGSNRGYTMVKFHINSNAEIYGNHRFTLIDGSVESDNDSDGHIPANTLLAFGNGVDSSGNIINFKLLPKIFPKNCDCLCESKIKLDEVMGGVNDYLKAPLRGVGEVSLLEFVDGWDAKVVHFTKNKRYYSPASSFIDISETFQRRRFVSEGNDTNFENDTYPLRSVFAIHLENMAEYGVDISSRNDLFKIKVNAPDKCAVKGVYFYTLGDDFKYKKMKMFKKDDGWSFLGVLKNFPFYINNDSNDWNRVVIEVSGDKPICQTLWRVDFSIIPNETKKEKELLKAANAADWRVNGIRFIIPYMSVDKDYGTFLVITNLSDKKLNVYMDVYGDGGREEGVSQNSYYLDIKLEDIPRRSTRIYFPKDFTDAIWRKFPHFKAYRYLAKFIVTAKREEEIEAAAFQQDGKSGKRSIPVLRESLHQNEDGEWVGHRFSE